MVDKHFLGLSGLMILKFLETKQRCVPISGLALTLAGDSRSFDP